MLSAARCYRKHSGCPTIADRPIAHPESAIRAQISVVLRGPTCSLPTRSACTRQAPRGIRGIFGENSKERLFEMTPATAIRVISLEDSTHRRLEFTRQVSSFDLNWSFF